MADNKGILSRVEENSLAEWADNEFDFENKVLEGVDGFFFKGVIVVVDDYGLDKLQAEYKEQAENLADALFEKDYDTVLVIVIQLFASILTKKLEAKKAA